MKIPPYYWQNRQKRHAENGKKHEKKISATPYMKKIDK
jgi:hypothetical protein